MCRSIRSLNFELFPPSPPLAFKLFPPPHIRHLNFGDWFVQIPAPVGKIALKGPTHAQFYD